MNVKQIAGEVIAALPEDADFDDLEEFLFERARVEQGREDCEAGRVLSNAEVIGDAAVGESDLVWAEHAATDLREAIAVAEEDSRIVSGSLIAAVRRATQQLLRDKDKGITLSEMGDPSIRELHVQTPRTRYRLVYDTRGSVFRVLWFTNNTTCYRNARPPL
jgi:hypothetical protein